MRTLHKWAGAVLLISLLSILPTASAPTYQPGVQPGDRAYYGDVSATWQSDPPGLTPPDPIYIFLVTQSILIEVTEVSGTIVTFSGTLTYTNGTSSTETATGDIATGDLSFWINSSGLNPGDPIYSTTGAPTINYTTTQVFAGVSREAVVLDVDFSYTNLAGTVHGTVLVLWDRDTGILLQLDYTVFYDYTGQTASGTAMATLTETNLWSSGPDFKITANPTSLFLPVGNSGQSTITLKSLGNFTGTINLATDITPSVPDGPTVSMSTLTVDLEPNQTVTLTLTVTTTNSTAPGSYTVTVTGTNGTMTHSTSISLRVSALGGLPFRDDFDYANVDEMVAAGWVPCGGSAYPSQYEVGGGVLTLYNDGTVGAAVCWSDLPDGVSDWSVVTRVAWAGGSFGILGLVVETTEHSYQWQADGYYYRFNLHRDGELYTLVFPGYEPQFGVWHELRLDMRSGTLYMFFDGQLIGTYQETSPGTLTDFVLPSQWTATDAFDFVEANQVEAGPDFAIGATPNPMNLVAGVQGDETIHLTSLAGFSGTIELSYETAYDNLTCPSLCAIAYFYEPSVTLPPYGQATASLGIAVSGNATGTFGVRVTGTSGNLIHETILDVIVVQEPPPPINIPPIAVIYAPAQGFVGTGIPFDGFGSYDPDGYIQSYQWNFGDGTSSFGCCISHIYSSPGNYTVTLTVTDNLGATGTTTKQIQILQQVTHDVAVVNILLGQTVVLSGQYVNILVILQNRGLQTETVSLEVYADTVLLKSLSNIVLDINDPFTGFIPLTVDTEGLAPGNYTISATVILATDENPSDNTLIDGQLTVLPPPVITVTPDTGSLGTKVTVAGSGFPQRPLGYESLPILVSFNNQFIGIAIPEDGRFTFVFNIPHAQPGPQEIHALDTFSGVQATTIFTVTEEPGPQPGSQLAVNVDAGVIYFPSETAIIHIQTTLNGVLASPDGSITATLYKPDGSTQQLNLTPLGNGIYRAQYAVPRTGSLGTYAVVVTANHNGSNASAMASFEVKPTWLSSNAPRLATAAVGIGGVVAAVGLAWRKGYFRKKNENAPFPETISPT